MELQNYKDLNLFVEGENVEFIKGVLKKTHKGRYVVKPIKTNLRKYKRMNKRAFTKILKTLLSISTPRNRTCKKRNKAEAIPK